MGMFFNITAMNALTINPPFTLTKYTPLEENIPTPYTQIVPKPVYQPTACSPSQSKPTNVYSDNTFQTGTSNPYTDSVSRLIFGLNTLATELDQLRVGSLTNLESSILQEVNKISIPVTEDNWKKLELIL